jgi:hypothetical protein
LPNCAVTRSRAATALLLKPAAQLSTIRARNAKACVLASLRIAFQYPRDFTRQFDLRYRATRSHPPPPMPVRRKLIHEFLVQDTSVPNQKFI